MYLARQAGMPIPTIGVLPFFVSCLFRYGPVNANALTGPPLFLNMLGQFTMPLSVEQLEADHAEDFTPPDNEDVKFKFIDADLGQFMRKPRTAVAREYESKAQAILGLLTRNSIGSADTIADAAAYIAYGDKVAACAGEFCDEEVWARKVFDAIASPSSPALAFVLATLPLVAQLMRNHEKEVVKPVRTLKASFKIPFRKNPVDIRIPMRPTLPKRFRAQTVEPKVCAELVFSNPDVMRALRKRGIDVAWPSRSNR